MAAAVAEEKMAPTGIPTTLCWRCCAPSKKTSSKGEVAAEAVGEAEAEAS